MYSVIDDGCGNEKREEQHEGEIAQRQEIPSNRGVKKKKKKTRRSTKNKRKRGKRGVVGNNQISLFNALVRENKLGDVDFRKDLVPVRFGEIEKEEECVDVQVVNDGDDGLGSIVEEEKDNNWIEEDVVDVDEGMLSREQKNDVKRYHQCMNLMNQLKSSNPHLIQNVDLVYSGHVSSPMLNGRILEKNQSVVDTWIKNYQKYIQSKTHSNTSKRKKEMTEFELLDPRKYQYEFDHTHRILECSTDPCIEYRSRETEIKSCIHWGQRKLFLAEMEFLTKYSGKNDIVLYVGAGPGTHIPYLAHCFPDVFFVLVDPREFEFPPEYYELTKDRIQTVNCFFDDETALYYRKYFNDMIQRKRQSEKNSKQIRDDNSNQHVHEEETIEEENEIGNVLFMSDIRDYPEEWNYMEYKVLDSYVTNDMMYQMRWHYILEPHRSLFKFRFPYSEGETVYLDGEIYLPMYGPQTTTECRLVTPSIDQSSIDTESVQTYEECRNSRNIPLRSYSHKTLYTQMFHFNTRTRSTFYKHSLTERYKFRDSGLDNCFDCRSEIHVIEQYLKKMGKINDDTLQKCIDKAILNISKTISRAITLNETKNNVSVTQSNIDKQMGYFTKK